ncbi:P-type conjugative transfer protein TrbL [Escherichia coli]|nr:P-type conjugative transfer protein TrbL [Escherichia coli]
MKLQNLLYLGLLLSSSSNAAVSSSNILNDVTERYKAVASGWADTITAHATWLFWVLVLISMVWTFGMMALRKADLQEFFAEFTKFTITTGFYFWLLVNGPAMATAIISGMSKIGAEAAGIGQTVSPSSILDIGWDLLSKVLKQSSVWSPVDSAVGITIAVVTLVVLALIGVNMLLLLVSSWVLMYAGVFYLGFGGARWTSDMAKNYYMTVLGLASQLMTMILLIGVGKSFIDAYANAMSQGVSIGEMAIVLIVSIILLVLTNKVPGLVSGIITGASVGGSGIGTFGAGAALGGAGMAAAALATGGAAMAAGAANISGGASAIMSAFKSAQSSVAAGTDVASSIGSALGGGSDSGSASSASSTPLGSAMGGSPEGAASTASAAGSGSTSAGGGASESAASNDSGESASSSQAGQAGSSDNDTNKANASDSQGAGASQAQSAGSDKKMGAMEKAGRVGADMVSKLGSGIAQMTSDKIASTVDAMKSRVADTAGGKLASHISDQAAKASQGADTGGGEGSDTTKPAFDGDSLSGAQDKGVDREAEKAAFNERNA